MIRKLMVSAFVLGLMAVPMRGAEKVSLPVEVEANEMEIIDADKQGICQYIHLSPFAGDNLFSGSYGHIAGGIQLAHLRFAGAVRLFNVGIKNRHDIAFHVLVTTHRFNLAPEYGLFVGINDFHFIGLNLNRE